MIGHFQDNKPYIHPESFVASSADIIGDVTLHSQVSVWFQTVIRADNDAIVIGEGSNVQDGVVIHVDAGRPCVIGKDCVIGHGAILHGCTVGDGALIGIGAIVLNGAVVGSGCLVGAGALVTENKLLDPGHLYLGSPARKVRRLRSAEIQAILNNAEGYRRRAALYREA